MAADLIAFTIFRRYPAALQWRTCDDSHPRNVYNNLNEESSPLSIEIQGRYRWMGMAAREIEGGAWIVGWLHFPLFRLGTRWDRAFLTLQAGAFITVAPRARCEERATIKEPLSLWWEEKQWRREGEGNRRPGMIEMEGRTLGKSSNCSRGVVP